MKKVRALGLDSKVIDRHLFAGEERFTCGTIPEHLKEPHGNHKVSQFLPLGTMILPLSFIPRFFFLLNSKSAVAFINQKIIVQVHIV